MSFLLLFLSLWICEVKILGKERIWKDGKNKSYWRADHGREGKGFPDSLPVGQHEVFGGCLLELRVLFLFSFSFFSFY